jgi:hypothetical protein
LVAAQSDKLSTSALARELEIPVQQLFATLQDHGWIRRHGDVWVLTPKGEFEGGSYQQSSRYGRYIVWPRTLRDHQLIAAIESNQRISAAGMQRYYPNLHPRQINRALAELGLQQHSILGWELTPLGKQLGGQQAESDNSGAFYVTWPHEIVDHPVVHRELTLQSDQLEESAPAAPGGDDAEPDLFDTPAAVPSACKGIDGHQLQSPLEMRVCNWLYFAQLAHAYQRALPTEELVYADFYLPAGNVYIDCWDAEEPAERLSGKLLKRELYRELRLRHIEVGAADVDRLDEILGRGLLAFGIRC